MLNKEKEYGDIMDKETEIVLHSLTAEEKKLEKDLQGIENRLKKVKEMRLKIQQGELKLKEAKKWNVICVKRNMNIITG